MFSVRQLILFTAPLACIAFTPSKCHSLPALRNLAPAQTRLEASPREGDVRKKVASVLLAFLVSTSACVSLPAPSFAAPANEVMSETGIKYKLPPAAKSGACLFVSSAMGQANGARDTIPDFRGCSMVGKSAQAFDMSGAIMSDSDMSKVNFKDAQLSKGFMRGSKFEGADFSNGIVDRCDFEGANLKGAIFENAVLTSTDFKDADLTDADFTEAYLGDFDQKRLCKNPTLTGTNPVTGNPTKASAGCR